MRSIAIFRRAESRLPWPMALVDYPRVLCLMSRRRGWPHRCGGNLRQLLRSLRAREETIVPDDAKTYLKNLRALRSVALWITESD